MHLLAANKYTSFSLARIYTTFAFSLLAMIFCVILGPLLFLNSYQTVTTWWKGPPMLYILSFITGIIMQAKLVEGCGLVDCKLMHGITQPMCMTCIVVF